MIRTAARPLLEHNFNRSLGSFRSPSSRQIPHLMTSSPSRQQQQHFYDPQHPTYSSNQQPFSDPNKSQDPYSQARLSHPPAPSQPIKVSKPDSNFTPTSRVTPNQT